MKKVILVLVVILGTATLTSCGVSKTNLDSPQPKTKNVSNTIDKNSNYIKANEWMVTTFNSAKSVIQFSDKDAGIVKGKYIMRVGTVSTSPYVASTSDLYAIITIRTKDNESRIEIVPPTGMYSQKSMGNEYGFTPEMFNNKADVLISEFETHMLNESKNDNW